MFVAFIILPRYRKAATFWIRICRKCAQDKSCHFRIFLRSRQLLRAQLYNSDSLLRTLILSLNQHSAD